MKRVVFAVAMAGTMAFPVGCEKSTPGGASGKGVSPTQEVWPRYIDDIAAKWDAGPFSRDFIITVTNKQKEQLADINLIVTFYPAQGAPLERRAFQGIIGDGESRSVKVNVPTGSYQKVEIKGTASGTMSSTLLINTPNLGRYEIKKDFYSK